MDAAKRKRNRLKEYDYSLEGGYFVTVCTDNRAHILSCIPVGDGFPVPRLTEAGEVVERCIGEIGGRYPSVSVDKFVIMPNHLHMILVFDSGTHGTGDPSPTSIGEAPPSLGALLGWFKYKTTKEINDLNGTAGKKLWQRSYYDHVIRNRTDYLEIWQYIDDNPAKWREDELYSSNPIAPRL